MNKELNITHLNEFMKLNGDNYTHIETEVNLYR